MKFFLEVGKNMKNDFSILLIGQIKVSCPFKPNLFQKPKFGAGQVKCTLGEGGGVSPVQTYLMQTFF